jgi:hypothetical protein
MKDLSLPESTFEAGFNDAEIEEVPYADGKFLTLLDQGHKLTDDEFFEFLSESPRYLSHPAFVQKIALWQTILRNCEEKNVRDEARDRLKHIGETLIRIGSGKMSQADELAFTIWGEKQDLEKKLADLDNLPKPESQEKGEAWFAEKYSSLAEYAYLYYGTTRRDLILDILSDKFNKSRRFIEKCLHEAKEILNANETRDFLKRYLAEKNRS